MMMGIVLGVVVLAVLVGMFIVVYAMNQQTQRPSQYEDIKTDTKGCFNINQGSEGKE